MPAKYYFRGVLSVLVLAYLVFPAGDGVSGKTSGSISWQSLETRHAIIRYQSIQDLREFDYKVKYGPEDAGLKRLFRPPEGRDLADRVAIKIDLLFERVQEILDMRKPFRKVAVNIYRNRNQLHDAYRKNYKGLCRLRAWYRHKDNTIYLNVRDLHEGMLAHELAHAIVDNYLLVRPPRATAEILARYVDMHLKK